MPRYQSGSRPVPQGSDDGSIFGFCSRSTDWGKESWPTNRGFCESGRTARLGYCYCFSPPAALEPRVRQIYELTASINTNTVSIFRQTRKSAGQ